jgi:predicted Zn-dependent protease
MSVGVPDLQKLADSIVGKAKPGEQVEAYISRGGETSVRVYEGEVEHFVSAQSEGIGIRVIRDGRTGFAYAGTLETDAIAEVLAEARDNVQFAQLTNGLVLLSQMALRRFHKSFGMKNLQIIQRIKKLRLQKSLKS